MQDKVNVIVVGPNPRVKFRNGGVAKYVEYQEKMEYKNVVNSYFYYLDSVLFSSIKPVSQVLGLISVILKLLFCIKKNVIIHFHVSLYDKGSIKNLLISSVIWLKRKKLLVQIHGGRYSAIRNNAEKRWKIIFGLANAIAVFPGEQFEELKKEGYLNKLVKIANFVPDIKLKKNDYSNLRLLFLGRLEHEKGIFHLLDAFEKFNSVNPQASLVIAGNGSQLDKVKERAQKNRSIEVVGYVSGTKLELILESNNIFVLPSQQEGFPLSFLECSLRGMVPLITVNNAIPNFFEKEKEYLAIDLQKEDQLYQLLISIAEDPEMRKEIGERVQEKVQSSFTVVTYTPKLLEIYKEVLHT